MDKETTKNAYIAFRYIEGLCIAVFLFGFLWHGTEVLKLTLPQFMMLYGGTGAVVAEGLARIFYKVLKKKENVKEKKVKKEEEKKEETPKSSG